MEVPWMKFEQFIGHLKECTACATCSVWCEFCKKDVLVSKLDKHKSQDEMKIKERALIESRRTQLNNPDRVDRPRFMPFRNRRFNM